MSCACTKRARLKAFKFARNWAWHGRIAYACTRVHVLYVRVCGCVCISRGRVGVLRHVQRRTRICVRMCSLRPRACACTSHVHCHGHGCAHVRRVCVSASACAACACAWVCTPTWVWAFAVCMRACTCARVRVLVLELACTCISTSGCSREVVLRTRLPLCIHLTLANWRASHLPLPLLFTSQAFV